MLLPEIKEREHRFRLALRMGLPIFFLILAFISDTLINSYESITLSFYFTAALLLTFSIYFILFLIYNGFNVKITESVSKTFTREYTYKYLKKEILNNDTYTLILLSVDNLHVINERYGIKNGDKILFEVVKYIGEYFKDKQITNFPMGHIKGGDFVIGLKGKKEDYSTIVDLLCLKSNEFKINEIEVRISGAITDTVYSNNLDHLIENLFELQVENKNKKKNRVKENINPNDLESYVVDAISNKSVSIMTQTVQENELTVIKEIFVKLKNKDGKILHPKSYIKVVNKLGLTAEYDFLVLEKSVAHCMKDENIMISIQVNPTSLRNHDFLGKVKNLIHENEHIKNRLILMTSEVDYYSQIDRYNATLQSLRRDGIKIAIDRLGSFHTSFLYLRELDIDIVRFDGFYSKDIENEKYKNMMQGLNTMAHLSGVQTWLKLVENKEVKSFAQEIGIDYIQGKEIEELQKYYED